MKKLFAIALSWLALSCAVSAQVPNGGSPMVPNAAPIVGCNASGCTFLANGPYFFPGADGTIQFATGSTNNAAEYFQAQGGIAGAGASLISRNAAQTGNVNANFTAQGSGRVRWSNGSGILLDALDPGGAVSSSGQVQVTPSTSSGAVKIGNATYGVNIDCGTANCLAGGLPFSGSLNTYVATRWYVPFGLDGSTTAVGVPGTGSIRLFPIVIPQKITIGSLGARITTLSGGGNVQLAIYASSSTTGLPTGSALASTASITTGSTGSVNSAVSVQLTPGIYWLASNSDNGTVAFSSLNVGTFNATAKMLGSIAQGNVFAAQTMTGVSVVQAFGTWPSLTSASFTDVTASTIPVVVFQVSSVP